MLKTKTLLSLFILSLIALGGCKSLLVTAPVPYQAPAQVETMAVMAVYVAPLTQPTTPIADASTFNKKTDALAKELNALMEKKANKYQESLAQGLALQLGVEVNAGKKLEGLQNYDRFKRGEELESLTASGPGNFKQTFVAEGGLNVLRFEPSELAAFLDNPDNLRGASRKQMRNLEAQAIAVSYTELEIRNVAPLGKQANAILKSRLYIYDDKGRLAGQAEGETKPVTITGEDLAQYEAVLNKYPTLQQQMLTALTAVEDDEE